MHYTYTSYIHFILYLSTNVVIADAEIGFQVLLIISFFLKRVVHLYYAVPFRKNISQFPEVLSCHTTYMLSHDYIIIESNDIPALLLRFLMLPKVLPLSPLALNNTSIS